MDCENSPTREPPAQQGAEDPNTVLDDAPPDGELRKNPEIVRVSEATADAAAGTASSSAAAADAKATSAAGSTAHKRIAKRNLSQSDPESDNDEDENEGEIKLARKAAEKEHRESLVAFLASHKVDPKTAHDYKINLRLIKPKSKSKSAAMPDGKKEAPRFRVSFIAPDASLLETQRDVLADIQQRESRSQQESKLKATSTLRGKSREEVYELARKRLSEVHAPVKIDDIKVLNFGEIDTRSGFHSFAQIYPVGYKCEQTVTGSTLHKGVFKQDIICEIRELDGFPEFRITTKSTGTTVLATSEDAVWKQFYPGNIDKESKLSFFNLNVELLLEGLDGALFCEDYKFHFERGYGKDYTTDKDAITAKIAFVKKMERERRNLDRQRNRLLTKEEQERLAELQRRKEEEEKKMAKSLQRLQKERKDQSREEFKKSKERERGEEAEKRQRQKTQEKLEERAKKEENKKESKTKQLAKKEVFGELRKVRNEVNAHVLQVFDEEEKENDVVQQLVADAHIDMLVVETPAAAPHLRAKSLQELIYEELQPLPDVAAFFRREGSLAQACWDDFFEVANYVTLFRSLLGIDHAISFDKLLACLSMHSKEFAAATQQASSLSHSAEAKEDEMDVETIDVNASPALSLDTHVLEAELERVQMHLLKTLLPSVYAVLDLDQKEPADGAKRDKRQAAVKLPVNQLTWGDLVRTVLLQYLFSEMSRTKDETLHAVRGSKASNYRIAKNIARNIRYKWYIRNKQPASNAKTSLSLTQGEFFAESEDLISLMQSLREASEAGQVLQLPMERESVALARQRNLERGKTRPAENYFASEAELLDELNKAAEAAEMPEIYRRCCKVLLRVLKISASQQFLWEVNQDASPDYYSAITRPLMFSHVAHNLVNRLYDDGEEEEAAAVDEKKIAREFYADMKQVPLNCIAFSTELPTIVSAAQKLLLAIYRHTERWVTSPQRPPLEHCDEKCCLLTREKIVHQKTPTIKCGKCSGSFHLDCVENLFLGRTEGERLPEEYEKLADFFVAPTDDLVNQATEEWHCPFCLQEDFLLLQGFAEEKTLDELLSRSFYVDEWGPSAALPWAFNPVHSNVLERFARKESYLLPVVEALQIVTRTQSSPYAVHKETSRSSQSPWNFAERVIVLKALFKVLQCSEQGLQHVQRINEDGDKLMKYCSKVNFREAEFMSLVKEICGEDGVTFCRKLLDGFNCGEDGGSADYTDNFIAGRCVVCNRSTENDEDEEEEGENSSDKVLICDGCNGEAHLQCLGLQSVPYSSWYCSQCSLRQSRRDKKTDAVQLESLEHHRDREVEDELLNRSVERKMHGLDPFRDADNSGHTCAYCGLHELELCSPMVYGQSRAEHEQWVQLCNKSLLANDVLDEETMGTSIRFLYRGESVAAPKVHYPYFPAVDSADGRAFKLRHEVTEIPPTVVHEMCALHMFHARVHRSKHETRRRRRAFARVVEGMSGVFVFPLGKDPLGNEYWQFPFSNDLFIARTSTPSVTRSDAERDEFNRILHHRAQSSLSVPQQGSRLWVRVCETEHIRRLLQLLDALASDEDQRKAAHSLRVNVANTILARRLVQMDVERAASKNESSSSSSAAAEQTAMALSEEDKSRRSSDQPVEMQLNVNKGLEIPEQVTIDAELVFDPSGLDDDPEKETDISEPYFSLSTKKFYAIALVNGAGTMVKMGKAKAAEARTVIYTIRREGVPCALLEAELSEAWEDHLYYFSALTFKRSGVYTLSFHVQNTPNSPSIKPLVFKVVVETKSYRCGVRAALEQLHASKFLYSEHRLCAHGRKELLHAVHSASDELSAVRAALLSVFLALPSGALSELSGASKAGNTRGRPSNESMLLDGLLEPSGWNAVLEQTWCGAAMSACSPAALMECLLVLEFYINRPWFASSQGKLWSALPSPHFAIRCATLSSVAMRVFCLDKVLVFSKVSLPSREKRSRAAPIQEVSLPPTKRRSSAPVYPTTSGSRSAAVDAKKRMKNYRENEDEDEEEEEHEDDDEDAEGEEDDADDDEDDKDELDGDSDASAPRASSRRASKRRSSVSSRRSSRRKSRRDSDDDDDDSDNDSDDSESGHRLRRSSRASASNRRYSEFSEEEEEEAPSAVRASKRKQMENDDEDGEEVDFDEKGGVHTAAPKKAKTAAKSLDQQYADYVQALPSTIAAVSEEIAEYARAFPQLPSDVLDYNIRFLSVLRRLRAEPRTYLFWEPVDPSVPGYRSVISQPMDLGTIGDRIRSNYYEGEPARFATDLMLVWSNCKTFNAQGSVLHEYAVEFEVLSDRLMNEWINGPSRPENPDISEEL